MPIAFRTSHFVLASLIVVGTAQSQTAKKVAPVAAPSAAATVAPVEKSVPFRAIATFSDGTSIQSEFHEVKSPRDAASGMATGKRQYQPILIRKTIDKASPMFAKAMASKVVVHDIVVMATNGNKIELKNVMIESIEPVPGLKGVEEMRVSFTGAAVNGAVPKTMAVDDWMQQKRTP